MCVPGFFGQRIHEHFPVWVPIGETVEDVKSLQIDHQKETGSTAELPEVLAAGGGGGEGLEICPYYGATSNK